MYKRSVEWASTTRYSEKRATISPRNCQFQLSSQSFLPGFLLPIIRPQPRFLSILAPTTRTVVHLQLRSGLWSTEGGGCRCSREWNLHGKGSPPYPGPWQQQVSTSHRRSFDRPPCPVPRASSEISGISNSGWGPCTAPTQVQHVE